MKHTGLDRNTTGYKEQLEDVEVDGRAILGQKMYIKYVRCKTSLVV
jgi:hypothetical protein